MITSNLTGPSHAETSRAVRCLAMRKVLLCVGAIGVAASMVGLAAPAEADVTEWLTSDRYPRNGDPGCESIPFLGLNPYIRSICDDPIQPDGSWLRYRVLWHPTYVRSTCGGRLYEGGNCPPWIPHDALPASRDDEIYVVTPDTIPPGEPGHLD